MIRYTGSEFVHRNDDDIIMINSMRAIAIHYKVQQYIKYAHPLRVFLGDLLRTGCC